MRPRALHTGSEPAVTHRASPPPPPGREWASAGAWQLVELLGSGGSSQIWLAVDAAGRTTALKIPHESSGAARALLAREHAWLAALAHGHVVATFGLGTHRSAPVLALEYLPGGDLVSLAGAAMRHWIDAARAVHAALGHLHARGLAHRDVKARNVLFGADGRARLIDFASVLPFGAPAPRAGTTAAHRAPGPARMAVAAFDDVYAFAVLLYELLAGRLPYGVDGHAPARGSIPAWPLAASSDPAAAALADCVLEVLAADDAGLSAFADVLESAAMAHR